ncbi:HpcH/HpaI aldolase/citrate lyase family protein [Mycobacterium kyogaense]|uniref:HpcH/HpaI aldolase/citrate lyase family protein n=1 Tax=Mycobacterium kyogaense TaxID=2212479 RepID=UPI000DAC6C9C|nr:CoA ester lyase [Mycobacterium kyogaense]
MTPPRSQLYVPGDRADRLAKASGRGADALIIDLEDSVPSQAKPAARRIVAQWLSNGAPPLIPIWIRVNSGYERELDLEAISSAPNLTGLVLAKTENVSDVEDVARVLSTTGSTLRLAPLVESAAGVCAVNAIAAGPRVEFLHLGELDLAADLGMSPSRDGAELSYARSALVIASRAAGIEPPVAPVEPNIDDLEHFRTTTEAMSRMGFVGRACIHPAQVTVANAVFTPDPDEVASARELLDQFDARGAGRDASGRMVDEAVLRRARRVIAAAAAWPTTE